MTTQSLQRKLDNPLTCTSDEVVITVLAMAAYAVRHESVLSLLVWC
jgi:hypothetical protein